MMYVNYKEFGKRLAARRKELGLKQSQVNEMADLSDKYLSNLERATSVPSIDVLMKLCNALQTTPDYLLLGTTSEYNADEYQTHIMQTVKQMNKNQIKLASSLIDWVLAQEI